MIEKCWTLICHASKTTNTDTFDGNKILERHKKFNKDARTVNLIYRSVDHYAMSCKLAHTILYTDETNLRLT